MRRVASTALLAVCTLTLVAASPDDGSVARPAITTASVPTDPPHGAAWWPQRHLDSLRQSDGVVTLRDVDLGGGLRVDLDLFEVEAGFRTAVVARFVQSGRGGRIVERPLPPSAVRAFRGEARAASGESLGDAWIGVGDHVLGGFVRLADGTRFISSGPYGAGLPAIAFDPALVDPALLPEGTPFCNAIEPAVTPATGGTDGGIAGVLEPPCHELAVAIETDVEFNSALFGGNLAAAAEYAFVILGASSEVFGLDVGVRFRSSYLRLWEGSDPWDQGSTGNQLTQFRDHWQALQGDVPRDLAHFFSGRGLGGGVAWLPGLCNIYNYALSANLGGSFPYPLEDHRHENWDPMVVTHEFGHNVGSPHTHSTTPPIDNCGNGDCAEAWGGTIMSYCHTCSGGMSNIVLSFHPGSIASMQGLLDAIGCDYRSEVVPAAAVDDRLVASTGSASYVDPLRNDHRANCQSVSLAGFDAMTAGGREVLSSVDAEGRPILGVAPSSAEPILDSFQYQIIDELGSIAFGTVELEVIEAQPATPVVGAEPAAEIAYYEIPESSVLPDLDALSPYLVGLPPIIEFPSTGGNFAESGRADLVAARVEGWIEIPTTGVWRLFIESDDGSRIWVDDVLLADNDGLHGMVERSGDIALAAGKHPIRADFFENYGGAGLIIRWQGPGVAKAVIPASAWSHGGWPANPDLNGDGIVNGHDLGLMIGSWGPCNGCPADLNGDLVVDGTDLAGLFAGWNAEAP